MTMNSTMYLDLKVYFYFSNRILFLTLQFDSGRFSENICGHKLGYTDTKGLHDLEPKKPSLPKSCDLIYDQIYLRNIWGIINFTNLMRICLLR